jgi:hypothetical protein
MSEPLTPSERDQRTGRFLTGNSGNGGRKPGSRSKLGEAFVEDLRNVWNERGIEALHRCVDNEPAQFLRVIASLMPRDVNLNLEISATEFAGRFATAMTLLGNTDAVPLPRPPLRQIMQERKANHGR